MDIIDQVPFKIFPVNKAQNNAYSYDSGNPIIKVQWEQNFNRVIDPKSLRLCGKLRIFNKNNDLNQSPANTFDQPGSAAAQLETEYVAYRWTC